jgi:RNA polymerase subunit RPABC4/transcription elongation factor Spt4
LRLKKVKERRRKRKNKMVKEKACKICNMIYEGSECPNCGNKETTDSFKGKIYVFSAENSEIASKLNFKKPGKYALKTR